MLANSRIDGSMTREGGYQGERNESACMLGVKEIQVLTHQL